MERQVRRDHEGEQYKAELPGFRLLFYLEIPNLNFALMANIS